MEIKIGSTDKQHVRAVRKDVLFLAELVKFLLAILCIECYNR